MKFSAADSGAPKGQGDEVYFAVTESDECSDPSDEDLNDGFPITEGNIVIKDVPIKGK